MTKINKFAHPIKKEFSKQRMNLNHNPCEDFLRSQWQNKTASVMYLTYRWIIALFFTAIVVTTMVKFWFGGKYLFYLTHWGLLLCLANSIYAAIIVTLWHYVPSYSDKIQSSDTESSIDYKEPPPIAWSLRIYWILHMTTLNVALLISFIYWILLFPSEENKDEAFEMALNISEHAFNSILMIIDIMIVGHPVRVVHGIFPALFGITFGGWSAIHYAAGLTDIKGNRYIYPILNWAKPEIAIATLFGCAVLFLVLSILTFLLYKLRISIYKSFSKSASYDI